MPKRPPPRWFDRVKKGLAKRRDVTDAEAVAGWLWYHGMSEDARRRVLQHENPRVSTGLLDKAIRHFQRFHGRPPKRGDVINVPDAPRVVVMLGELLQVNYRAKKEGDSKFLEYYHRFEEPRPLLVTDAKGRRLFIAGGRYKVTEEGIEG